MSGSRRLPRRVDLRAGRTGIVGLLAAALLSGAVACSVRLEDDAPRVPLVPTRAAIADEAALLAALQTATARYAAAVAAAGNRSGDGSGSGSSRGVGAGPTTASVSRAAETALAAAARRAAQQVSTLRALLLQRGVPPTTLDRASSPASPSTGPTTGSTTAPTRPTTGAPAPGASDGAPDRLTSGPGPADISALLTVTPANRAMLGSILVEHAVTAIALGGGPAWPARAAPSGAEAVRPLQAMQAARYGLQVAAAQADASVRPLIQVALGRVTGWQSQLRAAAGDAAGPPAVGYALPFAVGSPAAARRLAAYLLPRLLPALLSRVPTAADAAGLGWLLAAATEAQRLGETFGAAPPAFPGLSA